MKELVRLGVFVMFLGLSLRVAWAKPEARRPRVNLLLIYVLGVSVAVGLTQRDIWPFSAYRIFYHAMPAGNVVERVVLRVIDGAGRECEADRLYQPVALPTLHVWLERIYPGLTEAQQQRVLRFLVAEARGAADRAAASRNAVVSRALDSLRPPAHWALYAISSSDDFLRCVPYAGLRLYRDVWRPSEAFRDRGRISRHLVWEYRRP